MPLEPGSRLGNYVIVRPLGLGGMAEVYLAKDSRSETSVALKVLRQDVADEQDSRRRFIREARAVRSLAHPNIVRLDDLYEENGRLFLATEYVEGVVLSAKLRSGSLPLDEAVNIAIQLAAALEAAHQRGVVHRDLKPDNIMISRDGQVKVLDFGLAKWTDAAAQTASGTLPGTLLGTLFYMSPEQARGLAVNHRTDLWSLGVILYEMYTGKPPFRGAGTTETLTAIVEREPEPVHGPLARVLRKALRKNPDDRYQTAAEMRADLKKLVPCSWWQRLTGRR